MRWTAPIVVTLLLALPAAAGAQQGQPLTPDQRTRANNHHKQGWQALSAESWEAARDEFQKAIEISPKYASAHYGLGKAFMGLKLFPRAAEAFSASRDAYADAAGSGAIDQMAVRQRRQDRIHELQEALREQQTTRNANSMASQRTQQELQDQIRQLQDLQKSSGTVDIGMEVPAEVYLALGSAYFRSNKQADAEREYRLAVKARPSFGEAWNNLAVVCLLSGRASDAQDAVKKAEKAGFRVNPQLKDDIKAAMKGT